MADVGMPVTIGAGTALAAGRPAPRRASDLAEMPPKDLPRRKSRGPTCRSRRVVIGRAGSARSRGFAALGVQRLARRGDAILAEVDRSSASHEIVLVAQGLRLLRSGSRAAGSASTDLVAAGRLPQCERVRLLLPILRPRSPTS